MWLDTRPLRLLYCTVSNEEADVTFQGTIRTFEEQRERDTDAHGNERRVRVDGCAVQILD